MATAQQSKWSSGKFNDPVVKLSGFEQITRDIPQDQWLSTPAVVDYIRQNFETRYVPEWCISALGLEFSDKELNGYGKKPTGLVKETTIISLEDVSDTEHEQLLSYEMEPPTL